MKKQIIKFLYLKWNAILNLIWKILIWICIIAFLCVSIPWLYKLIEYKNNYSLPSLSLIFQIGFNIIYLVIASIVAYIAYSQLKKTRESTNIQSLHAVLNRYNSNEMMQKRSEFANMILTKEVTFIQTKEKLKAEFGIWTKKTIDKLTNEDIKAIAKFRAQIEPIIDEFEIIGYFKKRGIYSLSDIYQLFSSELQRYWLLLEEIGYIEYLRINKASIGEKDLYEEFQKLFENCIGFEIFEYERQIDLSSKKAKELIEKKKGSLELFFYQESLLLNSKKGIE